MADGIYFNDRHTEFRQKVRDYLNNLVLPNISTWENDRMIPRKVWAELGRAGLLGLNYPKIWGGYENDIFHTVILLEELGRLGSVGFRSAIAVHAYMACYYLNFVGDDFLKEKYLISAITGNKIAALALTEPNAGSDLNQINTSAMEEENFFVINGHKTFITNAAYADFFIVAVKTQRYNKKLKSGSAGVSLIVIDAKNPNIKITPIKTIGWHCAGIAEVYFNNIKVPAANLLGKKDYGFINLLKGLQFERLAAALLSLGGAQICLEATHRFLAKRAVFGKKLNRFQAIQHRLADMSTDISVASHYAYHVAWLFSQNKTPFVECSMIKLKATELAKYVVNECMQFHGSEGYIEDTLIARMYRDTCAASVTAGPSELMRDIIASQISSKTV